MFQLDPELESFREEARELDERGGTTEILRYTIAAMVYGRASTSGKVSCPVRRESSSQQAAPVARKFIHSFF